VVKLSEEERNRLEGMIRSGKHPAQRLMKARPFVEGRYPRGEGWNDRQIAQALETRAITAGRVRRQLVEEGLDSVLARKHSPNSARRRIFDGAAEAKLIALTCSEPPTGHVRWTLRLLEEEVVERQIVESVSDNTIGRTLKKSPEAAPE
jgi:hypothetical protein